MTKPGYKHTELGWIPLTWDVMKLLDCVSNKGDYGINAPAVDYSEELPLYLRITDIDDLGRFIKNDNKCVSSNDSENYFLQKGDIVFARTGSTTGKTYLYNEKDGKLVFAGFLIRFKPITDILLPYYLKLITNSYYYWDWVKIMSSRSGQPGINSIEYGSLKIPLPPLPEQKKISETLSTWDKAIETTENLINAKTKFKNVLMQLLLTGKKRYKEFQNEKWKSINLGQVTELISRRNSKLIDARIYSVTNNHGFVFQSDHFSREVAGEDLTNYKIIKKHEFAYNPARINVGSIAYFKAEIGIISSLYVCFRTTKDLLDEYLSYLLQIETTKFKIRNFGEGGVRVYLWYPLFATIKVSIPNITEQKKIANTLNFLDREIELLNKQLEALKEQKKGLMQKLLTGEIRVKV